jgi:hypothetical protein
MVHPLIEENIEIQAILEVCTTYKGVPYGPALIHYKDPADNYYSFKGIGIFKQGILHMTPLTLISGDGVVN